jgi:mono/diheme cytochrome c family protein
MHLWHGFCYICFINIKKGVIMKKVHVIIMVLATVVAAAIVLINPSGAISQRVAKPASAAGIPDEVMKTFQNSCMKCHGTGGNGMAMSMVNFSDWDKYSPKKQAKKALAIVKELKAGAMPPSSFRSSNPDKIPTAAQVETISNWAATLNPPKK